MGGAGSGQFAGGIARFLRTTQRAVANLRSQPQPSSSNGYSQLRKVSAKQGRYSQMTNSPSMSPKKLPKHMLDSPSNLQEALDRSAFGQSMSPSYDSIQRPRVLSTPASLNEFEGLSAHAGFFKPASGENRAEHLEDGAGSPRSHQPPPMLHPDGSREGLNRKAGAFSRPEQDKSPAILFSPSSNPRNTPPQVNTH